MKNQAIRNKTIWGVGTIIALSLCYILSRHDVLGKWHFMFDWPLSLFILGLIVIIIAALFYCRKVMSCTVIGYITGFVLATLFNSDYAGPGDTIDTMSYNNGWQIWTVSYLAIIIIGVIWELVSRRIKKKKS